MHAISGLQKKKATVAWVISDVTGLNKQQTVSVDSYTGLSVYSLT